MKLVIRAHWIRYGHLKLNYILYILFPSTREWLETEGVVFCCVGTRQTERVVLLGTRHTAIFRYGGWRLMTGRAIDSSPGWGARALWTTMSCDAVLDPFAREFGSDQGECYSFFTCSGNHNLKNVMKLNLFVWAFWIFAKYFCVNIFSKPLRYFD